jgi:hypothetical protein
MTSGDPRRSGDSRERRRCHPRGMSVLSCPPIRSETSLSSAAGTAAGRRHHTLGRCHARSPARRHGSPVRHAAGRGRLARRYGSMSHRRHREHATSRSDSRFAHRQARHGQPHRVRPHRSGARRPCRARTPRRLRRPGRPGRHRHHHHERNRPCAPDHQPVRPPRHRCERNRPCVPNHQPVRPPRHRCERNRPCAPNHQSGHRWNPRRHHCDRSRPCAPNRRPPRPSRPGCHHRDRSRPCAPNHRPGRPRHPGRPGRPRRPWHPGRLSHGLRHCHRPDDRVRNPRRHAVTGCRLRPLSPTS